MFDRSEKNLKHEKNVNPMVGIDRCILFKMKHILSTFSPNWRHCLSWDNVTLESQMYPFRLWGKIFQTINRSQLQQLWSESHNLEMHHLYNCNQLSAQLLIYITSFEIKTHLKLLTSKTSSLIVNLNAISIMFRKFPIWTHNENNMQINLLYFFNYICVALLNMKKQMTLKRRRTCFALKAALAIYHHD